MRLTKNPESCFVLYDNPETVTTNSFEVQQPNSCQCDIFIAFMLSLKVCSEDASWKR